MDVTKISNLTIKELIPLMEEQFNIPSSVVRQLETLIEEEIEKLTSEYQAAIDDLTLKVSLLQE